MTATAEIKIDGDGSSAKRAWEEQIRLLDQVDQRLLKMTGPWQANATAAQAYERVVRDAIKGGSSALDQHRQKLGLLEIALQKGAITQQQRDAAVAKARQDLARTSQTVASSTQSIGQAAMAAGTKIAGMAAAYVSVSYAVGKVVEQNMKLSQIMDESSVKTAESELKLMIQGGFTPAAIEKQMPAIAEAVKAVPSTDLVGATQLQTQIASSGFKQGDVESGAMLKEFLNVKAAMNQFGKSTGDLAETVKYTGMYLKSQGGDLGAQGVRDLAAPLTKIFEVSDLQFRDMQQLAEVGAALKNYGLKQDEQLATFSALVDVMPGAQAATGLKNFATITATAGGDKKLAKTLKEIGLKPEDVAMATGGKEIIPTLKLMGEKLNAMKPEDKNIALEKLYGRENVAAASLMLTPEFVAKVEQRIVDQQAGGATYGRNVQTFAESPYARQQRAVLKKDMAAREAAGAVKMTWEEFWNNVEAEQLKQMDKVRQSNAGHHVRSFLRDNLGEGLGGAISTVAAPVFGAAHMATAAGLQAGSNAMFSMAGGMGYRPEHLMSEHPEVLRARANAIQDAPVRELVLRMVELKKAIESNTNVAKQPPPKIQVEVKPVPVLKHNVPPAPRPSK